MVQTALKLALKEWDVAINALIAGETIVLLRKGGIHEASGQFDQASQSPPSMLLYPTYEHQKPELLKLNYAQQVQPVESGWHPESVEIRAFATITHRFVPTTLESVERLLPYHVWNPDFVRARWAWKPHRRLTVLCLRVSLLYRPQTIPYQSYYGGCRSWLDLNHFVDIADAEMVLTEAKYAAHIEQIATLLQD